MKRLLATLYLLAGFVAVPASAVVIDFESTGTHGSYNSLNYAIDGFRFNATLDNIDLSANGGWSGTGPAHSGHFAALNNYGGFGAITKDDGGTFSFQSLWVKNWFNNSNRTGSLVGLLNGVEVASVSGISNGTWNQIVGNFSNIDTLQIQFGNFFLIDDIVLNAPPVDVPEPASMALFGLGLLGFAVARRRKK